MQEGPFVLPGRWIVCCAKIIGATDRDRVRVRIVFGEPGKGYHRGTGALGLHWVD